MFGKEMWTKKEKKREMWMFERGSTVGHIGRELGKKEGNVDVRT